MLTKLRNALKTDELPTSGAAAQTRLSWARALENYAAVPPIYKDFFEALLAAGRVFPYTILTPAGIEGFTGRITEKLVCDFGGEIHILERKGNTFEAQCYPLEGIAYVEVRSVLLDTRVKINGVTTQGAAASSTLKFNSVSEYLFTPILEKIRLAAVDPTDATGGPESGQFDQWMDLDYKFMNFARASLLAGEKVIQAMLQAEIRESLFTFLGKSYYRTISPTHASILTGRELILLREDEKQGGKARYGGVSDYIPLNKIASLSLGNKADDLLVLSIRLAENFRLEALFQASAKPEIDQLIDRYKHLTAT